MMDNKDMKLSALFITVTLIGLPFICKAQGREIAQIVGIKKKITAGSSTFVFKLYSLETMSNFSYRIDVYEEGASKVLQFETIRNGVPLEGKDDGFQIVDVDGDGYCDMKVLGGTSNGKSWYKTWLYNAVEHKFVWSSKDL